MKIAVFGLGYVGTVSVACLVDSGHSVVGVDVNADKCSQISNGVSPVTEPYVDKMLRVGVQENRLSATTRLDDVQLTDIDVAIVCVGSATITSGQLDMKQILAVAGDLGKLIRMRQTHRKLLCVFRSTMLPGSMEKLVLPHLASVSDRKIGDGYEVAINPEFLREGTAVEDYFSPAKIVIGERTKGISQQLAGLYDNINGSLFEVSFSVAEMLKIIDNSFHSLKVAFANEIGRIAHRDGIPIQQLMAPFLSDTKLNISTAYLRPGGAFGGSCLPKDLRALVYFSKQLGVPTQLLDSIIPSNDEHKQYLLDLIESRVPTGGRILLVGLSFKSSTDDMRESPLVDLAESLLAKGYQLNVFDPDLDRCEFLGQNLEYVSLHLPHLWQLIIKDLENVDELDLVVIGKKLRKGVVLPSAPTIDLNRLN